MHDIIIIGGSFAGLSAANQLGRARRDVLVLDTGLPRNRFAAAAHNILGHDGRAPSEILGLAREQLEAYQTVQFRGGKAVSAAKVDGGFSVTLANGETVSARRLILAHGITDTLPDIDGAKACWGTSVLHCPYCHGFEYADQRLGALVPPGFMLHMAKLYRDWSADLTMFSNGADLDAETVEGLQSRGVKLVTVPVLKLRHDDGHLRAVVTAEGEIAMDAMFVAPRVSLSSPIASDLGCAIEEGMAGPFITVDAMQATSVPGVYAAGDIARPMHNATFAMASGVMAAAGAHQSLLE